MDIKLKSKNLSHKIADELNCDVAELNQEKLCKITNKIVKIRGNAKKY